MATVIAIMVRFVKLQDLVCFGMIPLLAFIAFVARPVFTFLLDAEAANILALPLIPLLGAGFLKTTIVMPHIFALACNRPDISTRLNLYALLVVTPQTVLYVHVFGIFGAALSWFVYHIWAYAYGIRRIYGECLKISLWSFYARVLKVLALVTATYGVAALVLLVTTGPVPPSIWALMIAYTVASLAYAAGAYMLVGSSLRTTLVFYARKALRRRA